MGAEVRETDADGNTEVGMQAEARRADADGGTEAGIVAGIVAGRGSRPAAAGDRQQSGRFRFEFPAFFITLRHTY